MEECADALIKNQFWDNSKTVPLDFSYDTRYSVSKGSKFPKKQRL